MPRTKRFLGHETFNFKTGESQANWGKLVTLVKTMVRYTKVKKKHKAQSIKSEKSKP